MDNVVKKLIENNKTIATMESCTGGYVVNEITNINDSSKVLKFSAVTYSNEYKIKMGVDENIINEYSVYSIKTANDMAKKISYFANSNYGIGITGKLNKIDPNNLVGEDNLVYVGIYDKDKDILNNLEIKVIYDNRIDNKKLVCNEIIKKLEEII